MTFGKRGGKLGHTSWLGTSPAPAPSLAEPYFWFTRACLRASFSDERRPAGPHVFDAARNLSQILLLLGSRLSVAPSRSTFVGFPLVVSDGSRSLGKTRGDKLLFRVLVRAAPMQVFVSASSAFAVLNSAALPDVMSDASSMASGTLISRIQRRFFPSSKFGVNVSSPNPGRCLPALFLG